MIGYFLWMLITVLQWAQYAALAWWVVIKFIIPFIQDQHNAWHQKQSQLHALEQQQSALHTQIERENTFWKEWQERIQKALGYVIAQSNVPRTNTSTQATIAEQRRRQIQAALTQTILQHELSILTQEAHHQAVQQFSDPATRIAYLDTLLADDTSATNRADI